MCNVAHRMHTEKPSGSPYAVEHATSYTVEHSHALSFCTKSQTNVEVNVLAHTFKTWNTSYLTDCTLIRSLLVRGRSPDTRFYFLIINFSWSPILITHSDHF